jgi:hypothetical protein
LRGYTEEELMKLVKDKSGGKLEQFVPPFLLHEVSVDGKQRTLATFLAQPAHVAEPDQKRLKSQMVARDEAFVKHVLSCVIQRIAWNGDQDEDPRVSWTTLPPGCAWFTTDSPLLFVRNCYERLWDLVNERYLAWVNGTVVNAPKRLLLIGTTGIVKTVSMNYFMLCALKAGYKVLFETREKRFFLHDGVMESEELDDKELRVIARDDRKVFFLVDHKQGEEPPMVPAFTVAAVSPDRKSYKEFKKHDCFVLWMPLTTANEIIAMNSKEWKLGESVLEARLNGYGPIVRHVFRFDQEDAKRDLKTKIKSFDYDTCLKRDILMSSDVPAEFVGMSWWVLHVTTENFRVASKVLWGSRYIMQKVLANYDQSRLQELEKIIADGLASPDRSHDVDGEFQYWSCQRLAGGLEVNTFNAKYVGGKCTYDVAGVIQLPPGQIKMVRALPSVTEMVQHNGVVHYSKLTNEPLCDAAVVLGNELCLFQMTIGEMHDFKNRPWVAYCKAATVAGLAKVRFVFLVPFKDKFRVQQSHIQVFGGTFGIPVSLEVAEVIPRRRQ